MSSALVAIPEVWAAWDPLPNEPADAVEAFTAWLSEGSPAIGAWADEHAEGFGVSPGTVRAWSAKWRWRARADAVRFAMTRTAAAAALERIRDYGDRMGAVWVAAFEAAASTVLDAGARGDIPLRDAIALLKHSTEALETLRASAPAPRANLAALSDDELAALEDLSRKALPQ